MSHETNKVNVYIEIGQFSNVKYEYDKTKQKLEIDRILNEPFVYPYAYGFICGTLASDGDELDVLIITPKPVPIANDAYYNVYIIGGLYMEDEKGKDEKILCVLENDYQIWKDIHDVNQEVKTDISDFFENYKKNTPNKWSKIGGFMDKKEAVTLYRQTIIT